VVETPAEPTGCLSCGVICLQSWPTRRGLIDVPCFGRPVGSAGVLTSASRALLAWSSAHARKPGVEGQNQVEALLRTDLADDDPARPHPLTKQIRTHCRAPNRPPRGHRSVLVALSANDFDHRPRTINSNRY
jgi:hypothetical protein